MNNIEFKEARVKLNLTQDKLAELLGISRRQIINIEQGITPVSKNFEIILKVLETVDKETLKEIGLINETPSID